MTKLYEIQADKIIEYDYTPGNKTPGSFTIKDILTVCHEENLYNNALVPQLEEGAG